MTPYAITSALIAAQALFLPIDGQPININFIRLSNAISPILLKVTYDHDNNVHNLWGLITNTDRYLHHYGALFVRPATCPGCYDMVINAEASHVKCVRAKTAWGAKVQDYEASEATEWSIKVFIEAAVVVTWILDLCDPKTFYSNVTALAPFDHYCKRSGGLHALDMVSLTIHMSQYYKGTTDIPKYIFLLKDA